MSLFADLQRTAFDALSTRVGSMVSTARRLGLVALDVSPLQAITYYKEQEHLRALQEGGWQPRTQYTPWQLDGLAHTGIARRVLSLRAFDATREGWIVRFPELDPSVVAEAATWLTDIQQRLSVAWKIYRALFKAEQWGESLLVIGADDGQAIDQPLNIDGVTRVLWLKVFAKDEYTYGPMSLADSENFGLPENYVITDFFRPEQRALDGAWRTETGMKTVHWSRCIRFSTEDGQSRLDEIGEALEAYFDNHRSAGRAAASMSVSVYKVAGLIKKLASNEAGVMSRMNAQHMALRLFNALLMDKNDEDLEFKPKPITGLPDLLDRSAAALCAWTGIPAMILLGEDPAGFSTGAETVTHYHDTVRAVQAHQVLPALRRLLEILMRAENGPPGIVGKVRWQIEFNPLRVMTPAEVAKLRNDVYSAVLSLKDKGVLTRDEVRESLFRDQTRILPEIRLQPEAQEERRDRIEVGIFNAIIMAMQTVYGEGKVPLDALRNFIATTLPEIADAVGSFLPDPPEAETTEVSDEEALAAEPEAWKTAEEIAAKFGTLSADQIKRHRCPTKGANVAEDDPADALKGIKSPGLRWIKPGAKPLYRLSEVRIKFEGGGADLDPTTPGDGETGGGAGSAGEPAGTGSGSSGGQARSATNTNAQQANPAANPSVSEGP